MIHQKALIDETAQTNACGAEKELVDSNPHIIKLPESDWALWRSSGLRGAGFSAKLPLALASPDSAQAADRVLEAGKETERFRSLAIEKLKPELRSGDEKRRSLADKALRLLAKGKLPDIFPSDAEAASVVSEYRVARERWEFSLSHFNEIFDAGVKNASRVLKEAAGLPRFREALLWQNRRAVSTGIDPILRAPSDNHRRDAKHRQHEELIANYLQRYCLKNDTIGFFGPIGWAKLTDEQESIRVEPGSELVASKITYFEGWCIDALASILTENKALRPWLAPRLVPMFHLEGNTLYLPFQPPRWIPDKQALVLRACDGQQTARQIAVDLNQKYPDLFRGESDIMMMLEGMRATGLIKWQLEVPASLETEVYLRRTIERIEDEELRATTLKPLEELEAARDAVAASAGDTEKLENALDLLDQTFMRLTDLGATRMAGQVYAGRTLMFEDCRRDIEVEIGTDFIYSLGKPLSLLLTSARWLTYKFSEIYEEFFNSVHADIARNIGSPIVDMVNFTLRVREHLVEGNDGLTAPVIAEFQRKWSQILDLSLDAHRVSYTSEELSSRVAEVFNAPRSGWSFARYHSPDVMIAAESVEAIKRGEYFTVLGEMHVGVNTLGAEFFMKQHPARHEFIEALGFDIPETRLELLRPMSESNTNARSIIGLISPKDYLLAITPDAFGAPAAQTLPVGSLVVENIESKIMLRTRDSKLQFELVQVIGSLLSALAINSFKMLSPLLHAPRITIDKLVVYRESWRFRASSIGFATEKDESARFLAARQWIGEQGIPRFCFVRTPSEVKPFYVDFASHIYINILAKMIRRTLENNGPDALISLSEMLPSTEQTWLPDGNGQKYTSEFRVIAVDQR